MELEDRIAPLVQVKVCVHHWLIDAENLGICKKCGSTRQFCGWWDVSAIRKGWSSSQNSTGGSIPNSDG